jgi:hypothetical protein
MANMLERLTALEIKASTAEIKVTALETANQSLSNQILTLTQNLNTALLQILQGAPNE